jgi:hypothetical protein
MFEPYFCALRSDNTDARKEARRCVGRSDRRRLIEGGSGRSCDARSERLHLALHRRFRHLNWTATDRADRPAVSARDARCIVGRPLSFAAPRQIIAPTGWGQEVNKDGSREAGCDAHLAKPVNIPELETLPVETRA